MYAGVFFAIGIIALILIGRVVFEKMTKEPDKNKQDLEDKNNH
ncbi:hypothetical protein ACFQ3J_05800 [Paenibacillus provencensis]|uniref:Tumour necrosis factor receptor superfamily member 19 n=1 Tax=Paenibacillus provencensis TaxID=441151 RepID=A0ABW3PQS1_9BACL|nr:hypothetical protein [Paenibacillus sp. MER 78]